MSDTQRPVLTSWQDRVLVIELNRPKQRNAIDLDTVRGVRQALREAESAAARAIVLTGGAVFSAGADIKTYASGDRERISNLMDEASAMCDEINTATAPVIAAVEGLALGGGFECVLASDLVVAAEDVTLGLPEVGLGLLPGWGGTQRLTAQIGPRRAKEVILLGTPLNANQAADLGLVNRVCPSGHTRETAISMAAELAARPARAVAYARQVIGRAPDGGRDERTALNRLFETADAAEGIDAFVNKREPVFEG